MRGRHAWIVDDDPSAFHLLLDLGERLFQFLHRRESRFWLFGHCTNHHSIERTGNFQLWFALARRNDRLKDVLGQRLRRSFTQKWHNSRQHLVHDAAGGVLIDAVIGLLAGGLLGRHVLWCSEHHADLGEFLPRADFGDAEVDDLYKVFLSLALEEKDVLRFEVAVDDALGVRRVQTACHLCRDQTDARWVQRSFQNRLRQRLSLEKLHHEIGVSVGKNAEIGDVDDVAVADFRSGLGFLDEALHRRRVLCCLFAQDFYRHRLVDEHMAGLVDHAHAAFTQPRFDGISTIDCGAKQRVCLDFFGARGAGQRRPIPRAKLKHVRVLDLTLGTSLHSRLSLPFFATYGQSGACDVPCRFRGFRW
ncbi:MAG: hypothetical protein U0787_07150 [Polyangia bacterium]